MRQAICYSDRHAKRAEDWQFVTRNHQLFYGVDVDQRPNGLPTSGVVARNCGQHGVWAEAFRPPERLHFEFLPLDGAPS